MEYKAYTDKGTRDHNEDDCGFSSYGDAHCLVVADGLGGHGGGDVASKCAVDAVCTLFMERGFSDHFFADAFSGAQNAILEQQALTQRFSTMKTTLVVLVVDNGWIHWAHIGDSRLYIFRGKRLLRRTLDHSVPQMLAQAGEIREADIRHHPDRNRLMRVMGVRNDAPRFEVGKPIRLTGAYQFLLCTDGYWELIEEDDMLRTLKESATPQQWLSQMNRIILENGRGQEMDNYTAIAAFETGRGLFGRKTH